MHLEAIINHIADQADEVLAGAANRAQARAGIEEVIAADSPALPPDERSAAAAGVMRILDQEGLFRRGGRGSGEGRKR